MDQEREDQGGPVWTRRERTSVDQEREDQGGPGERGPGIDRYGFFRADADTISALADD